jgi:type II secretory pathway predicted ATPase ExeA
LDERHTKPSLADDPSFVTSLSELDRGLSGPVDEAIPDRNVEPLPQQAPPPPRPVARVPPAPITPPPVVRPITIAAPPPPLAAHAAPTPSAVGLPEPPPWLPPSAVAAITAASAALTAAFESPFVAAAPAGAVSAPTAPASGSPRTLLDLFPPAASRESTAPDLSLRDTLTVPPPIAAVEPPRVASKRRAYPAQTPPRGVTYETFYGFDETPFGAASDLRFLYHGTAHDRALQELVASVGRRDTVAVLTGESGIGKTMLCRALVDQLDRRTLVSFVAHAVASPDALLKTLLVDFGVVSPEDADAGLAAASRDDLAGVLRDFLGSLAVLQASALVIVDDAHTLSSAVLGELRGLAEVAAAVGLLQFVFVGEPSLTKQLSAGDLRALDQRVKARVELGPLDDDEVSGYVAHRLAVAGRGERVDFSEPAIRRIFSLSRGVPGVINQVCDRALTLGYQASASRIDGDFVEDASKQLGLSRAETAATWRDRALIAALMIGLMLAGAAAAGWVFRDPLSRAWAGWHHRYGVSLSR